MLSNYKLHDHIRDLWVYLATSSALKLLLGRHTLYCTGMEIYKHLKRM